jgi:hypothetical protein
MLKWQGLFVRRYRFPRVVDGFFVPATAGPSFVFSPKYGVLIAL